MLQGNSLVITQHGVCQFVLHLMSLWIHMSARRMNVDE